mmetsp:Transcript_25073/g.27812  ORF Transcript_25073/g.27812 Transcript_25073/m.27812 type:complete len:121 (-) Transcript_25073:18-380(-)
MVKMYLNIGGAVILSIRFDQGKAGGGDSNSILKGIDALCDKVGAGIGGAMGATAGAAGGPAAVAGAMGGAVAGGVAGKYAGEAVSSCFDEYIGQVKIDDNDMFRIECDLIDDCIDIIISS